MRRNRMNGEQSNDASAYTGIQFDLQNLSILRFGRAKMKKVYNKGKNSIDWYFLLTVIRLHDMLVVRGGRESCLKKELMRAERILCLANSSI